MQYMKKILLLFVSILCTVSVLAQDMKTVFVAMPDSITPLLTKVNKEDCIDFLASDMKAVVKNRFGNVAEMKVLTDDYVQMQISEVSTLEMKLLPVNDSTRVVCMVRTVCASACDSSIRFYSSDWSKELDVKDFLQVPSGEDFFLPNDSLTDEAVLARKKADMHVMKAMLSKDDASLTYLYTTPEYLNKEDKEKLLPLLKKDPIVFRWSEGRFR
jgi:hypothetical protein